MDSDKELERERARRIKLEEELAFWLNGAMEKIPTDELAVYVQNQQVETLSFHLTNITRAHEELKSKYAAKEKELAKAVENIGYLEKSLEIRGKEVEKLKAAMKVLEEELAAAVAAQQAAPAAPAYYVPLQVQPVIQQQQGVRPIQPQAHIAQPQTSSAGKKPKTLKDFLQMMEHIERVKILDASILLEVSPETVVKWASELERKGYLTVKGFGDGRMFFATAKLLRK